MTNPNDEQREYRDCGCLYSKLTGLTVWCETCKKENSPVALEKVNRVLSTMVSTNNVIKKVVNAIIEESKNGT